MSSGTIAVDVFLGRKMIDTVWVAQYATNAETCAEARKSLINHDGYDARIVVQISRK